MKRRERLKKSFEEWSRRLQAVGSRPWPPSDQDRQDYSRAVVEYTEARRQWRAIRGWPPYGSTYKLPPSVAMRLQ